MASLIMSNSSATPSLHLLTHNYKSPSSRVIVLSCHCIPKSPSVRFSGRRRTRGLSVVTKAGPTTSNYIFAFVLPFSLLAVTIFTALRIGDRLDTKFLEELAVNEAILEGDEEDGDVFIELEEEPATPRIRNRPKREAESSSI